jgi:hypothetical protein
MTYPMTVVDTVFKALAPAIPDRTPRPTLRAWLARRPPRSNRKADNICSR